MKDIIHLEKTVEPTTHKPGLTEASTRENSDIAQTEDKQLPIESQDLLVDTSNGNGGESYLPSPQLQKIREELNVTFR
jgi:hypothetical protein